MRKLLEKWAALEPECCEKSSKNIFTVQIPTGEAKNIYDPDELTGLDLAWIQWAVQAAIVNRGWKLTLHYAPNCPDPNNPYDAEVSGDKVEGWGFGPDNIVEPLLSAYLEALEAER